VAPIEREGAKSESWRFFHIGYCDKEFSRQGSELLLPYWFMWKRIQDPVSGLTHLVGAFLGAGALVYLVYESRQCHRSLADIVAFSVFGVSLILLYLSSAFYHMLDVPPRAKEIFRQLDHAMIFVLIAGSYTPFCVIALSGTLGWGLLFCVWFLTIGGLILSIWWIHAPRWFSTACYLGLGWLAICVVIPLYHSLSPTGFAWLVTGGLCYTVGAVIYGLEKPDPFPPYFGFHEIWHLFVLAGSVSHFLSIASLLG